MNNESFMKEKPVIGLVLSMSLPMVFSMMVNALYNIVDSFFVAKISEDAMTALSLVFPVQNLMSAVSIGFGVGINAVIAFFLGAGEKKKADQAASLGFFWNAVQGLVLTVVCIAIIPVFLRLFSNDERTIGYALEYSRIVFLFGVIISCSLSFEKIFQAVGRMKVSMAGLLVGCLTNIILDPIFIFVFSLGSDFDFRSWIISGDGNKRGCTGNRDRTDGNGSFICRNLHYPPYFCEDQYLQSGF